MRKRWNTQGGTKVTPFGSAATADRRKFFSRLRRVLEGVKDGGREPTLITLHPNTVELLWGGSWWFPFGVLHTHPDGIPGPWFEGVRVVWDREVEDGKVKITSEEGSLSA